MNPQSLAFAELVGALVRDAPHDLADLFPLLTLGPKAQGDLLTLAHSERFEFTFEELGQADERDPAFGEIFDRAESVVVGGEGCVGRVGHDVRVRAIRRSLKTRLEKFSWALDSQRRGPLRSYQALKSRLESDRVVHSYRTQSADDTNNQKAERAGRSDSYIAHAPTLTTRLL